MPIPEADPAADAEPTADEGASPATGEVPDAAEPGGEDSGSQTAADVGTAGERRRGLLLPALLGIAIVVLGAFGGVALRETGSLHASAAQRNQALTDAAATSAVRDQITAAVQTIFSYSYADTARTRSAAQAVLTGPAVREYNSLFAIVERDAPAEKLIVTTKVTNAGVELLSGGRARVLVFANQQDARAGTSQASYGGAMFAVTAIHESGRWKIENINTFSQG